MGRRDLDSRDVYYEVIAAGGEYYRPCLAFNKGNGKRCGNYAIQFGPSQKCAAHSPQKEWELHKMKMGTIMSRLETEILFGDL